MILGRGPAPFVVLKVIEGLPDTSLTAAIASGGRQFYGWGIERYLLAEIYDTLNMNTTVTGNWKSKPPTLKPLPRPERTPLPGEKKKVTVRDLYNRFTRMSRR